MGVMTVNSRNARNNLRDLLDRVFSGGADVVIERNGKPMAVMIPVEDYAALQEELDDLRSARRVAEIYEEWLNDPSTGRPMEDVEADLISRGLLGEQT